MGNREHARPARSHDVLPYSAYPHSTSTLTAPAYTTTTSKCPAPQDKFLCPSTSLPDVFSYNPLPPNASS